MDKPSLHSIIQLYKYSESDPPKLPSKVVKSRKASVAAAKKVKTANTKAVHDSAWKDLPPSLQSGLTLVFIGYNPGVESSKQQHHYAHPTNLFWKLFNALDILSAILALRQIDIQDHALLSGDIYKEGQCKAAARHDFELVNFGVGFTDLVLRCTKQAQELSKEEKLRNVPRLFSEFAASEAPFIVFIGKGIWEIVAKYLDPKYKLANFVWGLQTDPHIVRRFEAHSKYKPKVYVFPNTSGLVALMKYQEKFDLWQDLVQDIQNTRQQ